MRFKSLKIALITLAVLIAITIIYIGVQTHTGGTRKLFVSYAITSPDKPKKVSRIEVKSKDTLCVFEQVNGGWTLQLFLASGKLTAPVAYPLDTMAFKQFLQALQNIEVGEIVSNKSSRYDEFEVAENGTKVSVFSARDSVSFFLGKQASDYIHWYVRVLPETEVRLSRGMAKYLVDKGADKWRDPTIISFDSKQLKELDIGDMKISRNDSVWQCDSGKKKLAVDKNKIEQSINTLANLNADGFTNQQISPEFTIKLSFTAGSDKILTIGHSNSHLLQGQKVNDNYLVKFDDNPIIFLVNSDKIDRIKDIFAAKENVKKEAVKKESSKKTNKKNIARSKKSG